MCKLSLGGKFDQGRQEGEKRRCRHDYSPESGFSHCGANLPDKWEEKTARRGTKTAAKEQGEAHTSPAGSCTQQEER